MIKDRSTVDVLYAAALMVVIGLSIYSLNSVGPDNFLTSVLLLLIINGFLVSVYIYNSYQISDHALKIRFGPLKETINFDTIVELKIVKNYWSSMALAHRRICIRYWYKEKFLTTTYISPTQLEPFLQELRLRSKNIQ